jgi:hypothetical protein
MEQHEPFSPVKVLVELEFRQDLSRSGLVVLPFCSLAGRVARLSKRKQIQHRPNIQLHLHSTVSSVLCFLSPFIPSLGFVACDTLFMLSAHLECH